MSSAAADLEVNEESSAEELLEWALFRFPRHRTLVTTGFGMEGCALLHLLAAHRAAPPVVYFDTHFLFPETHALRERLAARYPSLRFVNGGTVLTPAEQAALHGPELWRRDPDLCCRLRKVEPMRRAARGAEVWLTALSRTQSAGRAALRRVEWDFQYDVLKVNPLADWTREQVWDFVRAHDVPHNELHHQGYPSIGCTHCTAPVAGVAIGKYTREGRWQGSTKTECGLHGRLQLIPTPC
jgi:phosphoadenosine phosphosulfate reductase